MTALRRHPLALAALLFFLLAFILAWVPLFNVLGYEFAAAIGLVFGILFPPFATRLIWGSSGGYLHQFGRVVVGGWMLCLIPLAVILTNALFVRNCDPLEGFAFYLLIPIITVPYVSAVVIFWHAALRKRVLLACYLHLLASVLLAAHNLVFHPPVFTYHGLIGFFPGPIYDERVSITVVFVLARLIVFLFSATLLWLAFLIADANSTPGADERQPLLYWLGLWSSGGWTRRDVLQRSVLCLLFAASAMVLVRQDTWGLRPTRSSIQRELGGRYETEHFLIYYDQLARTADDLQQIALDHEFRYNQLRHFFDLEPMTKTGSYVYASPEQKKRLMGARHTAVEDPINHEMHLNDQDFPHPLLKHELAHVFASQIHPVFRGSLKMGLHEGIAVAAEWDDGALSIHQWSRAMQELGIAPPVQSVMSAWGFWTESASRSYTQAGSFVRFLVDTYGMSSFGQAFPTGNFRKAYSKPLDSLVDEWQDFLRSVPFGEHERVLAEYRFTRPSILAQPCAHEIAEWSNRAWANYSRGEYRHAVSEFRKIHQWDPANPRHLRGLLWALYAHGDLDEAGEVAQSIIDHPKASQQLTGLARKRLGDIHWLLSDTERAATLYQEVMSARLSEDTRREMVVKLDALASEHAQVFRDVLLIPQPDSRESLPDNARMFRLCQIADETNDPTALYLIGRRLFFGDDWRYAVDYLKRSLAGLSDNSVSLIAETHRLIALCHYHLKQYTEAVAWFESWASHVRMDGDRLRAADWVERCEWEAGTAPDRDKRELEVP